MQENLVSAAPNVILNLLQVKFCKILDCLRPFDDAKPAKSQAGANVIFVEHKPCLNKCKRVQTNIHGKFKANSLSVRSNILTYIQKRSNMSMYS